MFLKLLRLNRVITLKLCSQMINEIKILCQNDNNYNLLEKIETIQQKIQKNIVSNSSLYL